MKNVTITLDETVAQWARVEAAKAGKSLSRWIGERLDDDMRREGDAARGLNAWLDAPLWASAEGAVATRNELYGQSYDRPGFRGYEHNHLHEGPAGPVEGERGSGLAAPPRGDEPPGGQSSGSE